MGVTRLATAHLNLGQVACPFSASLIIFLVGIVPSSLLRSLSCKRYPRNKNSGWPLCLMTELEWSTLLAWSSFFSSIRSCLLTGRNEFSLVYFFVYFCWFLFKFFIFLLIILFIYISNAIPKVPHTFPPTSLPLPPTSVPLY